MGYTNAEINMIFSQVCLAAISGDIIKRKGTTATAVTFGDVNDPYYFYNESVRNGINSLGGKGFVSYDSAVGYAVSKEGDHDFKKHMTGDPDLSAHVSALLNLSIENAQKNKHNRVIEPLTYEKVQKCFDKIEVKDNEMQ